MAAPSGLPQHSKQHVPPPRPPTLVDCDRAPVADESHLDLKYFIDPHVYNCPFCNRRNVSYELGGWASFDWTDKKRCFVYFVRCRSCNNRSMHLSYNGDLLASGWNTSPNRFKAVDLDSEMFYSVPTSFFVLDERIPSVIRELISEADGSLKMNFLTGASACARKAIYELLLREKVAGDHYEEKIKALKDKWWRPPSCGKREVAHSSGW